MINKVNAPVKLALLNSSKGLENNPGASSGSGMRYERPPEQQKQEDEPSQEQEKPKLALVSELEKSGMTDVVKDFYEHKNAEVPTPPPGLATRYQADSSRTKGLLLNKKAE